MGRAASEVYFSGLNVFQVDAYRGVGPDDLRSLYGRMIKSLVNPLGIPESSVLRWRETLMIPITSARSSSST